MRTTITTATVIALLAAGTGSAAARPPDMPATPVGADATRGMHADGLRYKAEAAYYLHHTKGLPSPDAQDVARGVYPGTQPVRVVKVTGSGFDWADAGIGAGLAVALLLSAAGASALRRQHPAALNARR